MYLAQRDFLVRFGGLPSKERKLSGEPHFDFDLPLALDAMDYAVVADSAAEVGSVLSPIGEMFGGCKWLGAA